MRIGDSEPEEDYKAVVGRFEEMLVEEKLLFFDVNDFLSITEFYLANEEPEKALTAIEMAKDQHPYSVDVIVRYAQVISCFNKWDESLEKLELAANIEPFDPEIFFFKGVIHLKKSESESALECFQKVETLSENTQDHSHLLGMIGFEYSRIGEYNISIYWLKKAITADSENDFAMGELVLCMESAERLEKAAQYFEQFSDNNPFNHYGWFYRGLVYSKQEKFEMAVQAYDYCNLINTEFSTGHFNQGNAYIALENYTAALDCFNEVIRLEPDDYYAMIYAGECLEQTDQTEKALELYLKAIQVGDEFPEAYFRAALILDELNRTQEAENFAREAIQRDNQIGDYWAFYCELLTEKGNLKDGRIAFERAIDLDETNHEIWSVFSEGLYLQGFEEEAIELLTEGANRFSAISDFRFRLAAYFFAAGKQQIAMENLEIGLDTDPFGTPILFELMPHLKNNQEIQDLIDLRKFNLH